MKESPLTDKKIIKTLAKKGTITIPVICESCLHNVIRMVTREFNTSINFVTFPLDFPDCNMYKLSIFLCDMEEYTVEI